MEVRKADRRWIPGRQTLSRPDADRGTSELGPADPADDAGTGEDTRYDPAYDWFELHRQRLGSGGP